MRAPRLLRRTTFAASLVVTIGASAACGGKGKATQPMTNPPEVQVPPDRPAPDGAGTWKQMGDNWVYAYENGDQVWLGDDGECRLMQDDHCGEGGDGDSPKEPMSCNPPPPQDVECPPGKP